MKDYKFVKISFTGEEDAVRTLIRMYFGHIEYVLTGLNGKIVAELKVPVSLEEIEAELDEGTV